MIRRITKTVFVTDDGREHASLYLAQMHEYLLWVARNLPAKS